MDKNKLGYRNGRYHPGWFHQDWIKWSKTEQGKAELKESSDENKRLIKIRNERIDYEKELARSDLTTLQRQHYSKKLKQQKGE